MVNLVNGSKYYLAENNVSNGEGNGNPLRYSCLENSMDGGAWYATYSPWGCKESDTTERLHFLSFYSSFWRRKWQRTPVFLPGESHGQRGLVGYGLWGCKELDTTEQLTHTHTMFLIQCFKNYIKFPPYTLNLYLKLN